jgi:hypothetical protein
MDNDSEYGFQQRSITEYVKFSGALGEALCAGFKPHRIAPHVGPKKVQRTRSGVFFGGVKQVAKDKGAMTYQGAPCKRGHIGIRMVTSHDCIECRAMRRVGLIAKTDNPKGHDRGVRPW